MIGLAAALLISGLVSWAVLRFEVRANQAIGRGDFDWHWYHVLESEFLVVGAHLILVLFVLGWFSRSVRTTVAVMGDVVGYWPVGAHPCAARPYRFEMLRESLQAIDELAGDDPLVVVGHSQGSVLATDLVRGSINRNTERSVALVTCGSPLRSLYSRYFPREFNSQRLVEIANSTNSWVNYWRTTDPIATELGLSSFGPPEFRDERLEDGAPEVDDLKEHGDYWTDSMLRAEVDGWLADQ